MNRYSILARCNDDNQITNTSVQDDFFPIMRSPSPLEDNTEEKELNAISDSLNEIVIIPQPKYCSRKVSSTRGRYSSKPPPGKFWWKDGLGRDTAAGGILILDTQIIGGVPEKGIWVISEKSRKGEGTEYTDFGGRYHYDDGDICATIHREFREETYNTDEIPYKIIEKLVNSDAKQDKFVYRMTKGKYVCLIVDRKYLPFLNLNNSLLQQSKCKVLRENPYIPNYMYRTESLEFLTFSEIKKNWESYNFSFRLNDILINSPLSKYIFS